MPYSTSGDNSACQPNGFNKLATTHAANTLQNNFRCEADSTARPSPLPNVSPTPQSNKAHNPRNIRGSRLLHSAKTGTSHHSETGRVMSGVTVTGSRSLDVSRHACNPHNTAAMPSNVTVSGCPENCV